MEFAEVNTPLLQGESQVEKVDVDCSRELSLVRIHAERVIGILKLKYTVLQGITLVVETDGSYATVNKIVRVCYVLVNLRPLVD